VGAGVALLALLLLRGMKKGFATSESKKMEKKLFQQFKAATESGDAATTMRTLIKWLDYSGLAARLNELESALYDRQKASWSASALYIAVSRARKRRLREYLQKRRVQCCSLPPLNLYRHKAGQNTLQSHLD